MRSPVTAGVPATLAWLWPLIVDGFIVVVSLSVLHAVLEGRPARYPWCLLLLFSAVSVAGNVAHGPPTPVGRLVAAVPPVALVLAFDLLMRQVCRVLEPPPLAIAATAPAWVASGSTDMAVRDAMSSAPTTRLRVAHPTMADRTAALVARRRDSAQRVTGRWLAGELGISDGYARRLLRQLDHRSDAHAIEAGASR